MMKESKRSEETLCEVVRKIFEKYKFDVSLSSQDRDHCLSGFNFPFDLCMKKEGKIYLVELKFSRSNTTSPIKLMETVGRMVSRAGKYYPSNRYQLILVVLAVVTPKLRENLERRGVSVIDIQNLLYLIEGDDRLKTELISELDFSINDLIPVKPDVNFFGQYKQSNFEEEQIGTLCEGEELKNRISSWKAERKTAKKYATEYEDLCFHILKYLFNDDLALWKKQVYSNDDLFRFDLICKIKDGSVGGFWNTILRYFNSKYIVFEFKNYSKEITQKEIYTTDRYLYLKALRSVAIIISCNGSSEHANKAIRGTLRENGKLILSLSNNDLIEMINMKINSQFPSDYLYLKLDDLLIDLEK